MSSAVSFTDLFSVASAPLAVASATTTAQEHVYELHKEPRTDRRGKKTVEKTVEKTVAETVEGFD